VAQAIAADTTTTPAVASPPEATVGIAEPSWKEKWVFAYVGKQGGRDITTPWIEYGINARYEFDNAIYLSGIYHISDERSGGSDNNALRDDSKVVDLGYTFNLGVVSKLNIGYQYQTTKVKNIQMGGVRIGTYNDSSLSGHGPVLRFAHKVTQKFTADIALSRLSYTTDVTNNYTRVGASYNFKQNLFARTEYLLIDRSGWHSNLWTVGLGYNF
jgi:opacity protein-like surface antigen